MECAASYERPNKCQEELGGQGYAQRCRAPGASVWHEVWCRGPASGPPEEKKRGCGACAVGSDGSDGLGYLLATLAGAVWLARRRRAQAP